MWGENDQIVDTGQVEGAKTAPRLPRITYSGFPVCKTPGHEHLKQIEIVPLRSFEESTCPQPSILAFSRRFFDKVAFGKIRTTALKALVQARQVRGLRVSRTAEPRISASTCSKGGACPSKTMRRTPCSSDRLSSITRPSSGVQIPAQLPGNEKTPIAGGL